MPSEKKVSTEKYDKWVADWEKFHDANPDYKTRHGSIFIEMSRATIQDQIAALLYATRAIPESVDIEYISMWSALGQLDWTDEALKAKTSRDETIHLRVDFLKPKIKKNIVKETGVIKNY